MFKFPEKMLPVFRNESHQIEFEKNGYVILPFYNSEEIEALAQLYQELHPVDEQGFFPSTFSKDKNYRATADLEIKRIGHRSIDKYCKDIKVVCGSFIVKNPGPESGMCVHQDMTLVDESRFTGINIWVPLIDLTIENGALFVLPGSHRLFPTYRSSTIPEFFSPVMNEILDYLEPVTIKAGEAVFFDQSIIHFSPPNFSSDKRIVTNTYFTHQSAEYRTFYWDKDQFGNQVEAFKQDENFMIDFDQFGENIRNKPKVGQSLGLFPYDFPKINEQFLIENFKKTNARQLIKSVENAFVQSNMGSEKELKPKGIFNRLKKILFHA